MSAVAAMHEQVHHDAAQKKQDQKPVARKDMNPVFEPKQQSCDSERYNQSDSETGFPERLMRFPFRIRLTGLIGVDVFFVFHLVLHPFRAAGFSTIGAPRCAPRSDLNAVCQRLRQNLSLFSLSEFSTTDSDEALIAKAAKIGPIRIPKNGNRIPAAIGTPEAL